MAGYGTTIQSDMIIRAGSAGDSTAGLYAIGNDYQWARRSDKTSLFTDSWRRLSGDGRQGGYCRQNIRRRQAAEDPKTNTDRQDISTV